MKAYPRDRLYEEMAFLATYFHWGRDELMGLEHPERRRWCRELSEINRRASGQDAREVPLEAL